MWERFKKEANQLPTFGPAGLFMVPAERRGVVRRYLPATASEKAIDSLHTGDFVTLTFHVTDRDFQWLDHHRPTPAQYVVAETMIVKITSVEGDPPMRKFEGRLMNMPFYINPATLQLGSKVCFGPGEVYNVFLPKEPPQQSPEQSG